MRLNPDQQALVEAASSYVETYITQNVPEDYVFHNFQHTYAVVAAAHQITEHFDLSSEELLTIYLAVWFHDTGYVDGWTEHEVRGAELAEKFIRKHSSLTDEFIQGVKSCILATKMPHDPQRLLEEIVCDADLSHLGQTSYWDRCGRVRQEFALTRDKVMSDQEWIDFEINFMLGHEYKTEIARELFGPLKSRHVKQLLKRKRDLYPDQTPNSLADSAPGKKEKKKEKKKEEKKEEKKKKEEAQIKLSRGVETMFRASYRTHVNLSSIADNKANIMLSVNAIILSILAANLFPRLDSNPHLVIPSVMLVGVCLGSLFYAIQATRPKVTEGKVTREDIDERRSNLLFFGNFYNMEIEDFHYGMMEMIHDDEFLYSSMTRDLFYLGVVLAKKYRFLRACYNIFLFGLMLAVLGFIVAAIYHNMNMAEPSVIG